jgi:2-polyprenyl-3-methyl-5-hydroxy-6-metoxy-1,4-benzoquinol methylase
MESIINAILDTIARRRKVCFVPRYLGVLAWAANACGPFVHLALNRLLLARIEDIYRTERRIRCPINDLPAQFYCNKDQATYYLEPKSDIIFQANMPAVGKMNEYADNEYAMGAYKDYAEARSLKIATALPRLAEIKALTKAKRLLDVGCGPGFFLEAAIEHGFDGHGVEFSDVAISRARPGTRARISHGDVNALRKHQLTVFDVVTAFDIIEHLHDPRTFLKEIWAILAPGGVLALSTPDTGHFLRYLMGSRWPMLQPMQHTFLFSKRSVADLLEDCGFVNVKVGATRKALTIDYLGGQLAVTNPFIHHLYRSLRSVLPQQMRGKPFEVNIGELIAYARKPDPGTATSVSTQ